MSNGRIGAFAHFLLNKDEFLSIDKFDAPRVVGDLVEMNADYFFLTLGQNTGFYCSPNKTYEEKIKVPPYSRCSARDIPLELMPLLEKAGIDFCLYLPCQAPFHQDGAPESAFGFGRKVDKWGNREITIPAAREWARVIEEWSIRYGNRIKAWWFDGAYEKNNFTYETAKLYATAVRKGNPTAKIAFNLDVGVRAYMPLECENYTAGEINEPFDVNERGEFFEKRRLHVLTFLGKTWANAEPRYSTKQWIDWARPFVASGALLSLDIAMSKPDGAFNPEEKAQFSAISHAAK